MILNYDFTYLAILLSGPEEAGEEREAALSCPIP